MTELSTQQDYGGWIPNQSAATKRLRCLSEFSDKDLDPARLGYFESYRQKYFFDTFLEGQGCEEILEMLHTKHRAGRWLDLGAGTTSLYWALVMSRATEIDCVDLLPEPLAILRSFSRSDECPPCYQQTLKRLALNSSWLRETRKRFRNFWIFDALRAWPDEFSKNRYDTITAIGLFGLSPDSVSYRRSFLQLSKHLAPRGRVIGVDWLRSDSFVQREKHDNRYLSAELSRQAITEAELRPIEIKTCKISGDPLYDALVLWSAESKSL